MKKLPGFVLAWFFLSVFSSYAAENPYPIRNHRTDHTKQFEYLLGDDHRISTRSLKPDFQKTFVGGDLVPHRDPSQWHLFDQLGVPYKRSHLLGSRSHLADHEFIQEISVASEILVAVSNLNRVYMYKPTILERPISWFDKMGAPFDGELYLPANRRGWSLSCSVREKPETRRVDFMDRSEIVTYYTDRNGIKFDFGFTATIYVLLEDGQRIMYWDTGLPPSFSRGFLTPLFGTTQGQSISAAGSTVFISVVDSTNKLRFFTRMYDYEINGSCPGLTFTFKNRSELEDPPLTNGTVFLGFGQRRLPLELWREHLVDGIDQYLTSQVSIHLTGEGNSARELRIQGQDRQGTLGYYYKGIDESTWRFQEDARLRPVMRIPYPYRVATTQTLKDYTGSVIKAEKPEFQISLKSFHPLLTAEEPSTLTVSSHGKTVNLALHTVDGWNLVAHEKFHEDLIGVHDGESKSLKGTLVFSPELAKCTPKNYPLCMVIRENFLPYWEQTNALDLIADDQQVYLRSTDGNLKIQFSRTLTQNEIDSSFFMKWAMRRELRETPREGGLSKLLELNQKALDDLKSLHRSYKKEQAWFFTLDFLSIGVRPLAQAVLKLSKNDPAPEKATRDVEGLFKNQAWIEWDKVRQHDQGYHKARDILKRRIEELKRQ
jgi:hypothetical protein